MSHSNKRQRMDAGGGGGGGAAHRKQGANSKKRSHSHIIDKPHGKDEALARLLALNSAQIDGKRLDKGGGGGGGVGADDASIGSLAKQQQKEKEKEASGEDEGHRSTAPASHTPSKPAKDSQAQGKESKQNNKNKGKQQQHQHQQGQIKGKEDLMPGRKSVFRPVLRSGLEIAWPEIAPIHSVPILHTLLELLLHSALDPLLRPAKPDSDSSKARRQRRLTLQKKMQGGASLVRSSENDLVERQDGTGMKGKEERGGDEMQEDRHHECQQQDVPRTREEDRPIIAGLNSVTRYFEHRIAGARVRLASTSHLGLRSNDSIDEKKGCESAKVETQNSDAPTLLFVNKADVDPPSLIAHLPMLCCAHNAIYGALSSLGRGAVANERARAEQDAPVLLVPLGPRAELHLSAALRLRRVTALLIRPRFLPTSSDGKVLAEPLLRLLRSSTSLKEPRSDWLDSAALSAVREARGGAASSAKPNLRDATRVLSKEQPSSKQARANPETSSSMHPFYPTRIKHLRSSAPADLNAHKVAKKMSRAKRKVEVKEAARQEKQRVKEERRKERNRKRRMSGKRRRKKAEERDAKSKREGDEDAAARGDVRA
ncbi:hypothetical protein IE81DRAFT_348970 [Ceraceosorus guamensis]|uniref:Uncharacterized protein n=1 Tax=Ceraceosorus guamensis TaxID=1522189 RepID=A0A316VSY4_9BASI|nr:hypothetical protein IE81DRAFT_348970 [Ceraceosorus guamensis]PWN40749.1 hypothetical protein IE81DRAFT_348970 [Ceraceosorus guamensis]